MKDGRRKPKWKRNHQDIRAASSSVLLLSLTLITATLTWSKPILVTPIHSSAKRFLFSSSISVKGVTEISTWRHMVIFVAGSGIKNESLPKAIQFSKSWSGNVSESGLEFKYDEVNNTFFELFYCYCNCLGGAGMVSIIIIIVLRRVFANTGECLTDLACLHQSLSRFHGSNDYCQRLD